MAEQILNKKMMGKANKAEAYNIQKTDQLAHRKFLASKEI